MFTPFWIALQFLTTFPVQLKQMPNSQQNAQSLLFYPVVGLIIGLILCGIATQLHAVPTILVSTIVLVVWIWLTGGLHLDGLADTADAWVGGFGDPERTLKIMKDPSCGPIGVLSILILVLVKYSAIYVLLEQQYYLTLILFPKLGRLAPLFLFLTTPYVREKGLGSSMAEYIPKTASKVIFVLCFLSCMYFEWIGLITALICMLILCYLRLKFIQRISGITGDTIGASIEICEAVSILCLSVLLSY